MRTLPRPLTAPRSAWLAGSALLASLVGCSAGTQEARPSGQGGSVGGAAVTAEGGGAPAPAGTDEIDRMEEVRRVCARKASSAMARCWNQEFERTRNRKLEAQVEVLIMVSPGGTAESVKVIGNAGGSKELEACVAEEVRGWTYPEGRTATPVNCRFFLRSTM